MMGYKPLMRKYMTQEEWDDEDVQERLGNRKATGSGRKKVL